MKPCRGGAREGAGRPKTVGASKFLNVSVDPQTLKDLETLAQSWQVSKSEVVRLLIRKAIK